MAIERHVVDEAEFGRTLQPSDIFARFLKDAGSELGFGTLSLGAIQALVEHRTATEDEAAPADRSPA